MKLQLAWLAFLIVGGVGVYWMALTVGYLADDYFQLAAVEGRFGPHRDPFSNYTFAFEDPANIDAHRRRGSLPWWTTDDWHFGMMRPLSSLTLEIDYRLFPRRPVLSHIHSYLWFAAMLVAASRMFEWLFARGPSPWASRRVHAGQLTAMVALLAFMVDEANAYALMWIANRCAFVSATFAILAIDAHMRWREADEVEYRNRHWRLEWLWWALAFGAGEYATCGAAYVLAYELVGTGTPLRTSWRERIVALVPATVATVAFIAMYLAYGASSMGLAEYADPFVETGRFLDELTYKIPRLVGETWSTIPADGRSLAIRSYEHELTWDLLAGEGWRVVNDDMRHAALSGLAACLVGTAIVAALWRAPAARRRTAAWLAIGSVLAVIPVSSTMPQARLLVLPGLGFAGVLAIVVERSFSLLAESPRRWGEAIYVTFVAATLFCLDVVAESYIGRRAVERMHAIQESLDIMWTDALSEAEITRDRHVVILSQPEFITTVHGYGISNVFFDPLPASWHTLAYGSRAYMLSRPAPDVLEMSAIGDGMFTKRDERSFRRAARPFRVGERVDAGLFRAEVVALHPSGGVETVRYRFDRNLDDPSLLFLSALDPGLTPTRIPPVGGRQVVPLAKIPEPRKAAPRREWARD